MKQIAITTMLALTLLSCANDETRLNSVAPPAQKSEEPVLEDPQPGDWFEVMEDDEKEYRKFLVKIRCKFPDSEGWTGFGEDANGVYWTLEHRNGKTLARRWNSMVPLC